MPEEMPTQKEVYFNSPPFNSGAVLRGIRRMTQSLWVLRIATMIEFSQASIIPEDMNETTRSLSMDSPYIGTGGNPFM
jgi:hypothetical protein